MSKQTSFEIDKKSDKRVELGSQQSKLLNIYKLRERSTELQKRPS